MDWIVATLIIAPAIALYVQKSSWLIDYLIWVTVLNRGIRRYVDWLSGSFNAFSTISLTPLVISGLLFLLVFQNFKTFPPHVRRIFLFFSIALGIGLAVGLVRNQLAAVYALAEYIAPLSVMGCAAMLKGNERVLDRWVKTVGWAAVVVSLYGWYQYYTIPAWDAFWVRAVGFEGYLGKLESTKMTVFSTMSERGVLAGFLAFAVIPMMVSKRWRNGLGWISVAIILSVILLTFVRTAIITIAMAAILFPVLNRGKNTLQIIVLLCAAALIGNFAIARMPGSEQISARLQTLGSISKDGSFQGRISIAGSGLVSILQNPLGTGLGSTGLAGRVNTGTADANAAIGDNGYFEIIYSLGLLGAPFFFAALALIWKQAATYERMGLRSESLMLFKALFFTGAIALIAGNWLSGPGSLIFCLFAGFAMRQKTPANAHPRTLPSQR